MGRDVAWGSAGVFVMAACSSAWCTVTSPGRTSRKPLKRVGIYLPAECRFVPFRQEVRIPWAAWKKSVGVCYKSLGYGCTWSKTQCGRFVLSTLRVRFEPLRRKMRVPCAHVGRVAGAAGDRVTIGISRRTRSVAMTAAVAYARAVSSGAGGAGRVSATYPEQSVAKRLRYSLATVEHTPRAHTIAP